MIRQPARASRRHSAGLSMVEVMVAMVIGLIGTIIIFQVFEVSEGIKRTTTSGGDAQQNGVIGLYVIEKDTRNAGMGINDTSYAGCTIQASDNTRSPTNFTLSMVPVSITAGSSATVPDSFSVFYGSNATVANSTTITASQAAPGDALRVQSRYGARNGDLLLVFQPGTANCALMEITSLPAANTDQVNHDTGNYTLDWVPTGAVSKSARFNSTTFYTFTGAGTANATRVFNLGNLYDSTGTHAVNGPFMPVYNTYSITAGKELGVASIFSTAAAVPVADNIVQMRALYGLDDGVNNNTVTYNAGYTAGDGRIDRFVDAATFNAISPMPWQNLVAVRVVLVARSALAEKPAAGAGQPCDTTTTAPTWTGTPWAAANGFRTELDVSADANWKCYRYKTFETTIPLRNWIWKSA